MRPTRGSSILPLIMGPTVINTWLGYVRESCRTSMAITRECHLIGCHIAQIKCLLTAPRSLMEKCSLLEISLDDDIIAMRVLVSENWITMCRVTPLSVG